MGNSKINAWEAVKGSCVMQIIGHRGSPATDPENTVRRFRRAEADGADALELDVRLSRDGHVMVMHDADVDRTTNGTGRVDHLDYRQLRQFDAGDGERIPTLAEALDATVGAVQIEFKDPATVGPVVQLLTGNPAWAARVVVSSFSLEAVRAARSRIGVEGGLITGAFDDGLVDAAIGSRMRWIYAAWGGLTHAAVARARRRGLRVGAWPVNDAATWDRVVDLGVDGVTTDAPGRLVALRRTVRRSRRDRGHPCAASD